MAGRGWCPSSQWLDHPQSPHAYRPLRPWISASQPRHLVVVISGVMVGPGAVDDQPHWLLQVQDPSGPSVAAAPQFPHVMVASRGCLADGVTARQEPPVWQGVGCSGRESGQGRLVLRWFCALFASDTRTGAALMRVQVRLHPGPARSSALALHTTRAAYERYGTNLPWSAEPMPGRGREEDPLAVPVRSAGQVPGSRPTGSDCWN